MLGLNLWQPAEHRIAFEQYLCERNCCNSLPRYACKAPHTDLINLLDCYLWIPEYFQEIIRKCRSPDLKANPSARQLLALFPDESKNRKTDPGMEDIPKTFPAKAMFWAHCDECASSTTDSHYHYSIWNEDDLHFCPACVAKGVRYFVSEHRLIRRKLKSPSENRVILPYHNVWLPILRRFLCNGF